MHPNRPNNNWIAPAQWLAVISMTADHAARYLQPGLTDYFWLATTLGRLAFPLFAALVAWHALFNSRHLGRYTFRILLIGLIAQPGYAWMLQEPLSSALLNVCFTLAAGLALTGLLKQALVLQATRRDFFASLYFVLGLVLALLAAWLVAPWVDYGLVGILLVPALACSFYLLQSAPVTGPPRLAGLGWLLPGFLMVGLNPLGLPTWSSYAALLLIALLIRFSPALRGWPLRFPRPLWLSWYPLHLLVIAAAAQWVV